MECENIRGFVGTMPNSGIEWTKARRAQHAKLSREGQQRKRRVTPKALVAFAKTGVVSPELEPVVALRRRQYAEMADDLGGRDQITSLQTAVLDGWLAVQVIADVQFARLLQDPRADRLPATLATLVNSARANLLALGLERRVREVETPTLEALIDVSTTNDEQPDSSPAVEVDRGTQTNVSRPSVFAQLRARAAAHDDSSPVQAREELS